METSSLQSRCLAAALKDKDGAVKFLSNLAEIDFGYRDVAERLKKLNA